MRKFYKTTFTIDVYSEDSPLQEVSLEHIAYLISDGDCVGGPLSAVLIEMTPKQMVDALYTVGSEPGFFQLDDDGNDHD